MSSAAAAALVLGFAFGVTGALATVSLLGFGFGIDISFVTFFAGLLADVDAFLGVTAAGAGVAATVALDAAAGNAAGVAFAMSAAFGAGV